MFVYKFKVQLEFATQLKPSTTGTPTLPFIHTSNLPPYSPNVLIYQTSLRLFLGKPGGTPLGCPYLGHSGRCGVARVSLL